MAVRRSTGSHCNCSGTSTPPAKSNGTRAVSLHRTSTPNVSNRSYSDCTRSNSALVGAYVTAEGRWNGTAFRRSEEHTSELQSRGHLACRLLLEKKHTI